LHSRNARDIQYDRPVCRQSRGGSSIRKRRRRPMTIGNHLVPLLLSRGAVHVHCASTELTQRRCDRSILAEAHWSCWWGRPAYAANDQDQRAADYWQVSRSPSQLSDSLSRRSGFMRAAPLHRLVRRWLGKKKGCHSLILAACRESVMPPPSQDSKSIGYLRQPSNSGMQARR
jgi:hypothetical protein